MLTLLLPLCSLAQVPSAGTTRFVLDRNRMYAEVAFVRPDSSIHRALVFVDMGSPSMTLKESLFKELQLDHRKPLAFKLGNLSVEVPPPKSWTNPASPAP